MQRVVLSRCGVEFVIAKALKYDSLSHVPAFLFLSFLIWGKGGGQKSGKQPFHCLHALNLGKMGGEENFKCRWGIRKCYWKIQGRVRPGQGLWNGDVVGRSHCGGLDGNGLIGLDFSLAASSIFH